MGYHPGSSIKGNKVESFQETFFMSAMPASLTDTGNPYGDDKENDDDESKPGLGMRQMFLRQLAADVLIGRSLHGEAACCTV